MGENGGANCYQQLAFTPASVSVEVSHAHKLQEAFECYDDDGRAKRTGKDRSFVQSLLLVGSYFVLSSSDEGDMGVF